MVPNGTAILQKVQALQFADKLAAEEEMLQYLKANEDTSIVSVVLNPKPESLNSINGFVEFADGKTFFFKTHTEENEKLSEYYNAKLLEETGYPVVRAKRLRGRPGQQIAFYEVLEFPTLFDLVKSEEDDLLAGRPLSPKGRKLVDAQRDLDKRLLNLYLKTLEQRESRSAPIHQLFWHRLQENGRYGLYYKEKLLDTDKLRISFEDLKGKRWVVNGVKYDDTLEQIIHRARTDLDPASFTNSIVGHGDAHNGNVFYRDGELLYFDPAFAGRHDPILDLVKPLFHNVFARWMYFPEQTAGEFRLSCSIENDTVIIDHSYALSEIRTEFFRSKAANLLNPLLQKLSADKVLTGNWSSLLQSALFCCPFLTVNLFAPFNSSGKLAERYSSQIKLLGLSMAVELGALSCEGTNPVRSLVDEIREG